MITLHCPNSMCQFEVQRPQGTDCNIDPNSITTSKYMIYAIDLDNIILNTYTDCYMGDCNRLYTICSTTQSLNASNESSSRCRELSSGRQNVHSNEQPINCTVTLVPSHIMRLTCPNGGCIHSATSSNTACGRDLGIACGGKK